MTAIRRVSLAEMLNETGAPALGYSNPAKDEILIREGMPKHLENRVLGHEHEHMAKGEEGFFIGAALGAVAGGLLGAKGSKDAAKTSAAASDRATEENRRQYNLGMLANILLGLPSINTGNAARSTYAGNLGLSVPGVDYSQLAKLLSQAGAQ